MSELFNLLSTFMWCGTILGLALMIVLSLPKSHMREVMKRFLLVAACVVYIFSPFDIVPEAIFGPLGFIDDIGAFAAGLMAARSAIRMTT